MDSLSSNVKENIRVSENTVDLLSQIVEVLNIRLTPSQLVICVELIERGVSFKGLSEAIAHFGRRENFAETPKFGDV